MSVAAGAQARTWLTCSTVGNGFARTARARLTSLDRLASAALDAVASSEVYLWRFEDRRAACWHRGQVVLLGDAAVGFLPTAGVGAAMAIESAGVLASVLRDASADTLPARLTEFERRQRPRCEYAQDGSRELARVMFQRNPAMSAARDLAVRLLPARVRASSARASRLEGGLVLSRHLRRRALRIGTRGRIWRYRRLQDGHRIDTETEAPQRFDDGIAVG